jgi:hypothetical protein
MIIGFNQATMRGQQIASEFWLFIRPSTGHCGRFWLLYDLWL